MFDQLITFRHKELVAATKAIHDAERRLKGKASPQVAEARKLAFSPIIDERAASDEKLQALFRAEKSNAEATKQKAKVEEDWATKAKANYARAVELASSAK